MIRCTMTALLGLTLTGSALALLPACSSNSEKQRDEARESAASLREVLKTAPARVDSTMRSLFAATSGDKINRAVRFNDFKQAFRDLKGDAEQVRMHADRARADGNAYFKAWAAEAAAADPAKREKMKGVAEGRVSNYQAALAHLDGGRASYTKLIADLNDVQAMMDKDLAAADSADLERKVNSAKLNAVDLRNTITALTDRIDSALAKP